MNIDSKISVPKVSLALIGTQVSFSLKLGEKKDKLTKKTHKKPEAANFETPVAGSWFYFQTEDWKMSLL